MTKILFCLVIGSMLMIHESQGYNGISYVINSLKAYRDEADIYIGMISQASNGLKSSVSLIPLVEANIYYVFNQTNLSQNEKSIIIGLGRKIEYSRSLDDLLNNIESFIVNTIELLTKESFLKYKNPFKHAISSLITNLHENQFQKFLNPKSLTDFTEGKALIDWLQFNSEFMLNSLLLDNFQREIIFDLKNQIFQNGFQDLTTLKACSVAIVSSLFNDYYIYNSTDPFKESIRLLVKEILNRPEVPPFLNDETYQRNTTEYIDELINLGDLQMIAAKFYKDKLYLFEQYNSIASSSIKSIFQEYFGDQVVYDRIKSKQNLIEIAYEILDFLTDKVVFYFKLAVVIVKALTVDSLERLEL